MKFVIFDIDGTLFDEEKKQFTLSSINTIKKLQKTGCIIIIATGRPPLTLDKLWQAEIHPDYLICNNGHIVIDHQGQVILSEKIHEELVRDICEYCENNHLGLMLKYPDRTYVYLDHPAFQSIYERNVERLNKTILFSNKIDPHLLPNDGTLGADICEQKAFNHFFSDRISVVNVNDQYGDIRLPNVSKKSALCFLMRQLNGKAEDCIVFGDSLNDLEIIQWAGIGVAMGNAVEELKQKSDYVTKSIDEDGIQYACQNLHLI